MFILLRDVMELLCFVAELWEMVAVVKKSASAALWAGPGAALGALLGGIPGIAVGAGLGGILGVMLSNEQVKPLHEYILELSAKEQELLYSMVYDIIRLLDWTDLAMITALVKADRGIQNKLVAVLVKFFTKEIGAKVQYKQKERSL